MNYLKNYYDYIDYVKTLNRSKSDSVYYELHHILPKSLYPEYIKLPGNLILLTAREHFLAHYLLTKIYPVREMHYAFFFMSNLNKMRICSRHYEFIKLRFIQDRSFNTEEFIKKAESIHNNKYDYSLVNYKNNNTKIKIICPKHGEFKQQPGSHLLGKGCKKCSYLTIGSALQSNTKDFIEKANKVHNNKYDYSLVNYITAEKKVKIICPIHGEFIQLPSGHLSGRGCSKCSRIKGGKLRKSTTEEWIKKAQKVHGNRYDYSKVNYIASSEKIIIICKKHGEFKQISNAHLQGQNCPKCRKIKNNLQDN
jgi:hypothetical protein